MDFLKQYLKIISYTLLGLVFAFSSFYLLVNLYHYFELRKDFVADIGNQNLVLNVVEKLDQVQININKFNSTTYKGKVSTNKMIKIKQNIEACMKGINNDEFQKLKTSNRVTILDVYRLREAYENDIYNGCIINNLYWLVDADKDLNSTYLSNNKDLIINHVEALKNATSYLKKDLINNSSYFFNTSVASSTVKDNTRDGYYEVMDAYTLAADFVLYISNWFSMEVGG